MTGNIGNFGQQLSISWKLQYPNSEMKETREKRSERGEKINKTQKV